MLPPMLRTCTAQKLTTLFDCMPDIHCGPIRGMLLCLPLGQLLFIKKKSAGGGGDFFFWVGKIPGPPPPLCVRAINFCFGVNPKCTL